MFEKHELADAERREYLEKTFPNGDLSPEIFKFYFPDQVLESIEEQNVKQNKILDVLNRFGPEGASYLHLKRELNF